MVSAVRAVVGVLTNNESGLRSKISDKAKIILPKKSPAL
jgi:hypothetical protein